MGCRSRAKKDTEQNKQEQKNIQQKVDMPGALRSQQWFYHVPTKNIGLSLIIKSCQP